ncbi:MAG: hypothetical protein MZV64_60750 [Ignavibacteriales bacterium]|nr:hypothetical protein [Ignavibacteriales bacterium]
MNFRTDMSEAEYLRESNYNDKLPLSEDVIAEQAKNKPLRCNCFYISRVLDGSARKVGRLV